MMKVLYTYHGEWGHRQDGGGIQPRGVNCINLPHMLVSSGQHPAACNRLIFYSGLACKSSRAKPHCNTRSHKASRFNIISKVQTHWESGSNITSIFVSLDFPSFHPTSADLPYFSQRLTTVRVLTLLTNPKCPDSTSGNPLCCYSFEEECSNNLGFCHSSHPRYRSLHIRKHLEIPQTTLWRGIE